MSELSDRRGRHGNHRRGSRHPRWNDGRIISSHSYVKLRVGEEHPLADPNGYAYEHLLVWVSAGRAVPTDDQIIHHDNEDKTDNKLANLKLLTRIEHAAHHNNDRERNIAGRFAARRQLDGCTWDEYPEVTR